MKIGIKYCGGCNPTYNRKQVLDNLKHEFSNCVDFKMADYDTTFDFIVVICGCMRCCADYKKLKSKNGVIFILNISEYSNAVKEIKKLLKTGVFR